MAPIIHAGFQLERKLRGRRLFRSSAAICQTQSTSGDLDAAVIFFSGQNQLAAFVGLVPADRIQSVSVVGVMAEPAACRQ